jgi:hypothetical protein
MLIVEYFPRERSATGDAAGIRTYASEGSHLGE